MSNFPKCPNCGATGPAGANHTYCACTSDEILSAVSKRELEKAGLIVEPYAAEPRPLEDYLLVDIGDLLYPPSPDTETYWRLCEATLAEHLEAGGPAAQVERVRVTHPGWTMDWLGIGIVKKEAVT